MATRNQGVPKTGGREYRVGNLLCLYINADTLTNKLSELSVLVKDLNPDILGISEVLPKNHSRHIFPEEFKLEGYNELIHKNVENNTGRGSILYIKDHLNFKEVKFDTNSGVFEEGLFIELTVNKFESLLVASLYRRGESTDENNENLIDLFNEIYPLNKGS